jgi:NAD(P)-dependent dehydrogenase (short-subunit alcohol dehydrogenase family)
MPATSLPLPLSGCHAIVSGGSRGIGAAVARELDALGASLTLLGRDRQALQQVCAGMRNALPITVDIGEADALRRAVQESREHHGAVTILINNAGIAESAPFLRSDAALWSRTMAVNLEGVVNLCQATLPDMLAAGWGRIVNIASTAGLRGYPYVSAYCASKHAVVGLTRALAMEFVRKPITVNAICPGYVATELLERSIANIAQRTGASREAAERQLRGVSPQDRFVAPEEIAATVRWLCLPGAESVTGQTIALAGGEIQ